MTSAFIAWEAIRARSSPAMVLTVEPGIYICARR